MTASTRVISRLVLLAAVLALGASACSNSTTLTEGQLGGSGDAADEATVEATDPVDAVDEASEATAPTDTITDDDDEPGRQDEDADGEPIPDEPLDPEQLERLALLAADCRGGSDLACDILFQISAFDSDDEALARDCGGRGSSDTGFCTEGIVQSTDGPWFDGESDGVGAVVDLCQGGDLTACDFLYYRSAFDSEYESIGTSCGGQVAVAVPDCRTALGDE